MKVQTHQRIYTPEEYLEQTNLADIYQNVNFSLIMAFLGS